MTSRERFLEVGNLKRQAGNVDPGMEALKSAAVAGERKVASKIGLRYVSPYALYRRGCRIRPVPGKDGTGSYKPWLAVAAAPG
jgi:hypothetical protein